jgi:hypothetical protein
MKKIMEIILQAKSSITNQNQELFFFLKFPR